MLDNIREHSRVVCSVALQLADWLHESGSPLYRPAVEIGALLHDIAKTSCLGTPRRHDREGAQILADLGYPELAYLVGVHVRMPEPHPVDESLIVYYADKRVRHTEIVDIGCRYDYIVERYGRGNEEVLAVIAEGRARAMAAEAQIFGILRPDRTPGALGVDGETRP